mmetsp:Transcript_48535/g.141364  ORF Transcript_48535/g.141364 Transcript_48535/m.141364 type:complete len:84 (+) Transcript_48535:57-308(+)
MNHTEILSCAGGSIERFNETFHPDSRAFSSRCTVKFKQVFSAISTCLPIQALVTNKCYTFLNIIFVRKTEYSVCTSNKQDGYK